MLFLSQESPLCESVVERRSRFLQLVLQENNCPPRFAMDLRRLLLAAVLVLAAALPGEKNKEKPETDTEIFGELIKTYRHATLYYLRSYTTVHVSCNEQRRTYKNCNYVESH